MQQIADSSKGCSLCRLITTALLEQLRLKKSDLKEIPPEYMPVHCEISWTVDGREREHDGVLRRINKRTRRLCLEWTSPPVELEKAYIVLLAPPGILSGPRLFLGRLLTSLDITNEKLIKNWYEMCSTKHGEECRVTHDEDFEEVRSSSYFGVIDVENMCSTVLPPDQKYVALSYTWGEENEDANRSEDAAWTTHGGAAQPAEQSAPPPGEPVGPTKSERFKTKKSNAAALQKTDGIKAILTDLPKVIQDTIILVKSLGIRYLWVDSICILQDDAQSWRLNASVMNLVYGNADLTICAADGDGATTGLKAFTQPSVHARHARQFTADYKLSPEREALRLMLSYPSETYVKRSRWNERAWTFQERLLSKRCLIFTESRVYYQCRSTTMSEDIFAEDAHAGWSVELQGSPLQTWNTVIKDPVNVWKKSLEMYTVRKLSHQEDILAAFGGLGKEICDNLGGNHVFGLPNSHFDWALLWEPNDALMQRQSTFTDGPKFPTWSWCGWQGSTISYKRSTVSGCEINLHEWLNKHTWITWYIRDKDGNLRLVWNPYRYRQPKRSLEDQWKGYKAQHLSIDDYGGTTPAPRVQSPCDWYGRILHDNLPGRLPELREKFYRTMAPWSFQVKALDPRKDSRIPFEDIDFKPYLQFWTWSARFQLIPENETDRFSRKNANSSAKIGHNRTRHAILDGNGDFAGTIILNSGWSKNGEHHRPQEFIAISHARKFSKDETDGWTFFIEQDRENAFWELYNVLLLGYEEDAEGHASGIAHRVGIGKIYKEAFNSACRLPNGHDSMSWKEIILG